MLGLAGLLVILLGICLAAAGGVLAYRAEQGRLADEADRGGTSEFVGALASLMDALAKHPVGIRLVVLGLLFIVIGGLLGGVAGIVG